MNIYKKIPNYGAIERPENIQEAQKVLKENALDWKGERIEIEFNSNEFTTVCPSTNQPDFNIIKINYIPKNKYIESKSLKFYLWSFREFGMHTEYLSDKISNDIKDAIDCESITVTITQNIRGGIGLTAISKK